MFIHKCFNTQPPEGGWSGNSNDSNGSSSFNTQPPEGGWQNNINAGVTMDMFQHTAARRRLDIYLYPSVSSIGSFNTQPPEGGWVDVKSDDLKKGVVSTHSRPKAAGLTLSPMI